MKATKEPPIKKPGQNIFPSLGDFTLSCGEKPEASVPAKIKNSGFVLPASVSTFRPFEKTRQAVFRKRLNRFVLQCDIDGEATLAYMPNPGRLRELLLPGPANTATPPSP